jgi:hypothetical protein
MIMLDIALCIIFFAIGVIIGTYTGIVVTGAVLRAALNDSETIKELKRITEILSTALPENQSKD